MSRNVDTQIMETVTVRYRVDHEPGDPEWALRLTIDTGAEYLVVRELDGEQLEQLQRVVNAAMAEWCAR